MMCFLISEGEQLGGSSGAVSGDDDGGRKGHVWIRMGHLWNWF